MIFLNYLANRNNLSNISSELPQYGCGILLYGIQTIALFRDLFWARRCENLTLRFVARTPLPARPPVPNGQNRQRRGHDGFVNRA